MNKKTDFAWVIDQIFQVENLYVLEINEQLLGPLNQRLQKSPDAKELSPEET